VRALMGEFPSDARVYSPLAQGIVMAAGAMDAWGDDPMVLRRFGEFVAFDAGLPPGSTMMYQLPRLSPVWRIVRLQWMLDNRFNARYTRWDPLRRAELIDRWQVIDEHKQMLNALHDRRFYPHRTVLLDHPVSLPTPNPHAETDPDNEPPDARPSGTVRLDDLDSDTIEVRADTPRPAILLISDNYSESWNAIAMADSSQRDYDVVPGDYTLRAIPLSAGHHHLRLEYRPPGVALGKWISSVALLVWLAMPGWFAWRARSRLAKELLRSGTGVDCVS
jgi:hypothetical protein